MTKSLRHRGFLHNALGPGVSQDFSPAIYRLRAVGYPHGDVVDLLITAHEANCAPGAALFAPDRLVGDVAGHFIHVMRPRQSSYPSWIALALAHGLLADSEHARACTFEALLGRITACLDVPPNRPLRALARTLARLPASFWRQHTVRELGRHIHGLTAFRTLLKSATHLRVRRLLLRPARMREQTSGLPAPLTLPHWPTPQELACGLNLSQDELEWLCHPALAWRAPDGQRCIRPVASHYRCILRPKARGHWRLLEAPLPLLKQVQRQLLTQLLDHVPVHEAAYAFVRGRDVASHATVHAGQGFVAAFDLRDFFTSIGAARISALWRSLGYPEGTARCLTALTTTRTPAPVRARLRDLGAWDVHRDRRMASLHLPQGAPTSPALANLCAFGLDVRLSGLAERFGARYSRYADDLVFSGPPELGTRFRQLRAWVDAIVHDEGFVLHPDKCRRMPAHRQQRVTGLVINQRPQVSRDEYDNFRAQLHQWAQKPFVPANERAEVQGRLAWIQRFVCKTRSQKLARLFDQINFDNASVPPIASV